MKKTYVIGASGQLGFHLCERLGPNGLGIAREKLELSDLSRITKYLDKLAEGDAPDAVINATAYNQVDQAETDQTTCTHLNVEVPRALAKWCRSHRVPFIHYSTDYVFDGSGSQAWRESDRPNPLSFYGRSKWLGEQAVFEIDPEALVFRTSWVYSHRRENFLINMLRKGLQQSEITVVGDQIGNPTYADTLAAHTLAILKSGRKGSGLFHLSDEGHVSRLDFARAILEEAAKFEPKYSDVKFVEAKMSDFKTPAHRPINTRFSLEKVKSTFEIALTPWRDNIVPCLRRYYASH